MTLYKESHDIKKYIKFALYYNSFKKEIQIIRSEYNAENPIMDSYFGSTLNTKIIKMQIINE